MPVLLPHAEPDQAPHPTDQHENGQYDNATKASSSHVGPERALISTWVEDDTIGKTGSKGSGSEAIASGGFLLHTPARPCYEAAGFLGERLRGVKVQQGRRRLLRSSLNRTSFTIGFP